MKMLQIEGMVTDAGAKGSKITVGLPEGKTQAELINLLDEEVKAWGEEQKQLLYGSVCHITGRTTTGMALYLGHALAHVCKTVYIFDPKENDWVKSVWH